MLFVSESEKLVLNHTDAPSVINLGLERVQRIVETIGLGRRLPMITIAGTNGKGSVGKMLADILCAAGHRVGHYTSPHLLSFFERFCVNGQQAQDEEFLCSLQFIAEQVPSGSLTYFEMTTLTAVHYFEKQGCDIAVMEVGLGGRLDAVNVFSSMAAVITNVAMDHMDFLGNTRDKIAIEKAGVGRSQKPIIIGEKKPPATLLPTIEKIGAIPYRYGKDFSITENLGNRSWHYHSAVRNLYNLNKPSIQGRHQIINAACVLAVLDNIDKKWWPGIGCIRSGLHSAFLQGRTQILAGKPTVVLDVAHNVAAAKVLADFLLNMGLFGTTRAVIGMRPDKDYIGFIDALSDKIDEWYLGDISGGVDVQLLFKYLKQKAATVKCFSSLEQAASNAHAVSQEGDRIVVTGSFMTVAEYLQNGRKN